MILFGRKHLHVSETDPIIDSLFGILGSVASGSIKLEMASQPALKIEINKDDHVRGSGNDNKRKVVVTLDLLEPTFFSIPDDQTGLFDKLKTATEFAQKLESRSLF